MTMLFLWYFSAKSFKKFAGGKDNFSAIAGAITNITKTFHVQAIYGVSGQLTICPCITNSYTGCLTLKCPKVNGSEG